MSSNVSGSAAVQGGPSLDGDGYYTVHDTLLLRSRDADADDPDPGSESTAGRVQSAADNNTSA